MCRLEKLCKFEKIWRSKIVLKASNKNLIVKYGNNDQKHHISIKWQWKKLKLRKCTLKKIFNFW